MAAITAQRDLVIELKKETLLNVGILSKLQGMPQGIAQQVFNENALEKPTQNIFNNLSHYFVCIIDPKAAASLSWPLYDSKTERTYRNELANFISNYNSKGLLDPVMTSYLVNPNCYKVTLLIFQMSQLAIQKLLESKMDKDSQKNLYNDMTVKYKSQENNGFIEQIENETVMMLSKFSNYLHKRRAMEKIAEKIRIKISEIESKLASVKAQTFLDDIVDKFVSKHEMDNVTQEEILNIKNIHKPAPFFDWWLSEVDRKVDEMESKWSEKVSPFIQICKETKFNTESLLARHTGEAEKDTYMIEYNHKTENICTIELQNQVNSQQKYVLKNIIKEDKLNFPNLIRGFLIAICFILRNAEMGDDIHQFNECLEQGKRNYGEMVQALRVLLKRVANAEARLEPPSLTRNLGTIKNFPEIPLLPDLSDIRSAKEMTCQALFDSFTPISMSKHQFNLWRRTTLHTFVRPQSKLVTPFQLPKDDFLKNLISCRDSDQLNTTQNFHNLSIIPQTNRANETIAGCLTGCTKQQLLRLLSTKKTSSSKKSKYNERSIKIKKARLFNESISSNESNGLFRSYSSPNLYENREVRSVQRTGCRKLSVMQESYSPLLEVSGIIALDKDSSSENSRNQSSKKEMSVPTIQLTTETPPTDEKFHTNLNNFKVDLNEEFLIENTPKCIAFEKPKTPQNNTKMSNRTSSLEKIIKRYKTIRASVLTEDYNEKSDFRTIVEEKENVFTANKILLPDLLSPSCSVISNTSDNLDVCRKPRESLGTALGVDHTFLDQFDLID